MITFFFRVAFVARFFDSSQSVRISSVHFLDYQMTRASCRRIGVGGGRGGDERDTHDAPVDIVGFVGFVSFVSFALGAVVGDGAGSLEGEQPISVAACGRGVMPPGLKKAPGVTPVLTRWKAREERGVCDQATQRGGQSDAAIEEARTNESRDVTWHARATAKTRVTSRRTFPCSR